MRHMLVVSFGLCCLSVMAILSVMIGAGRLNPNWTPYFDHGDTCSDRLCLLGIVPGVTPWDTAQAILNGQHIPGLNFNPAVRYGWGILDNTIFTIQAGTDNNPSAAANAPGHTIMQMHFSIGRSAESPGLTAGAVVARFGAPCFVRYSANPDWPILTLYYPFGTVYVATAHEQGLSDAAVARFALNVQTPVSIASDIYSDAASQQILASQCRDFKAMALPHAFAWQGFRSARFRPDLASN